MAPKANKGKHQAKESPLELVAKELRSGKGPECRNAVIDNRRIDFFRAKDYLQYCKDNPSIFEHLPPSVLAKEKTTEDKAEALLNNLLNNGFAFRCDRAQKKPPPGKKKLLKWPKRVVPHPENRYEDDAFYGWIFEAPGSKWVEGIGSILLVIVTIGCCLFPLSPHWLKLGVLYTCLTLLSLIFFIAVVRGIIFVIVWVVLGRHFWVLPNLFSDEVGVLDAFSPWYAFDEAPPNSEEAPEQAPSLLNRLLATIVITGTVYSLYTYSPDTEEMALNAKQAHKSILEMLDLYVPSAALGDNSTVANATNVTDVNNTGGEGTSWDEVYEEPSSSSDDPLVDFDEDPADDERLVQGKEDDGLEVEMDDM